MNKMDSPIPKVCAFGAAPWAVTGRAVSATKNVQMLIETTITADKTGFLRLLKDDYS
jgi:hypothetical protein